MQPEAADDPEGFQSLLRQFLDWMQTQGFSPSTVAGRRKYLGYFVRWASQRGLTKPAEVTQPVLERYQRFVFLYRKADGDPLGARSRHHQLAALRPWFQWLARRRHIAFNPAADLELPRVGQRLPRHVLTPREVELVVACPDVTTLLGLRDRTMLEVLYSTGLRRLELVALRPDDVDRERGTVFVRQGKGKKDRVVPVGDRALAWVERYEHEARPRLLVGDQSGDVLFLTLSPFRNLLPLFDAKWV
jgi:integrase/recombinase XerD